MIRESFRALLGRHAPDLATAERHVLPADTPGWVVHGENYLLLLDRIHAHLKPATYAEIGIFQGDSLSRIGAQTDAIGIDPAPQIRHPLTPRTRVFALTSDEFFRRYDLRAELGGRPLGLGFIDGMHHFEYALRDFMNLERHCARDASILLHDCYPLDRTTAARERSTRCWSGDVWRTVLALRKYRPDLAVHTLAAAPTGLGLIRNLDPDSRVLGERYDEIVAEFMALDYAALGAAKDALLGVEPADWGNVQRLLAASG
jgi:hypothetical protein